MPSLNKILVANRGEIAVRVIRTAKAMGYRTVAVYSEADHDALHTSLADEAVLIGAPEVSASYLNQESILAAAHATGADAIHPGYGFLSENTDFSEACARSGITFIGPDARAIELMGNKRQAKIAMLEAGVPCIPGYEGADQSDETLQSEARRIGFPIMVKAAAGGGGRGMRQVDDEASLLENLKSARSEATNAFGSGELILEKAIVEPRHIEIQVFADRQGHCIYLGERDCSIQRRFQKVVEESPSPFMTDSLRQQMGEAAVRAALSCDYVGAGTVEFLVDHDRNFYFLEMNTRLQVEHPVTELVAGVDLVAWQITVAEGHSLPLSQEQVSLNGHAIEVRLYAEDPADNFLPQTGQILDWQPPGEVRVDHGIQTNQTVSPFYDPILAKVIAYGSDRETARRKLICALEDMKLLGVKHNQHFLSQILKEPVFAEGQATTAFLNQQFEDDAFCLPAETLLLSSALAALIFFQLENPGHDKRQVWGATRFAPWLYKLHCDTNGEEQDYPVSLTVTEKNHYQIQSGDQTHTLNLLSIDDQRMKYSVDGRTQYCHFVLSAGQLHLSTLQGNTLWQNQTHAPAQSSNQSGDGRVLASMDGVIIDVLAKPGDRVEVGQTVMVLEAMKMEHALKARVSGTVETVSSTAGDQVKTRQCLLEIVAEEAEG
ncbi:acetyl/propionyl/methylcrotonyl-CoA carboxylase subunit alpha [Endozoicomonas numazuensis]|uniref:Biotin carboxylase n=1 Tax=Endozoicomonas numazuensis TaxID=1137799 RepID=A0A081NJ00_9GAMM|nr:acetyl-CoA carboxylase biotin carboxylase subunit [Endozoicomonas numazuensis]KEQ18423.1 3-methylcrotonyl-CoA carboxylase [Endozoicomonas numazuensis]